MNTKAGAQTAPQPQSIPTAGIIWSGDPLDDDGRIMAWTTAIAMLFVIVGVIGVFSAPVPVAHPRPIHQEEMHLTLLPTPTQPEVKVTASSMTPSAEASQEETPIAIPVVAPMTAGFAVPVIGTVNPSQSLHPLAPPVQAMTTTHTNVVLTATPTGQTGERPYPAYPRQALELRMEGAVELALRVDAIGRVTSVEVTKSSGHRLLDQSASEFIKAHWVVPPRAGVEVYDTRIRYELKRE